MASEDGKADVPVLFGGAADCCGCESCLAACPRGAISVREDGNGFAFPHIDEALCIGCHACVRACGLHRRLGQETQGPWYAAAGTGDVSRSASAGAFVTLARGVIARGGCVFGAAYEAEADGLHVRHRMADDSVKIVFARCAKNAPPIAPTYMRQPRQPGMPVPAPPRPVGEALSRGARSFVLYDLPVIRIMWQ